MNITVHFFGPLADATGQERVVIDLPRGARYGDLLDAIGERFGGCFHHRMWDAGENEFKPGIIVTCGGNDLEQRETPLVENQEIRVVPVFAGG